MNMEDSFLVVTNSYSWLYILGEKKIHVAVLINRTNHLLFIKTHWICYIICSFLCDSPVKYIAGEKTGSMFPQRRLLRGGGRWHVYP